MNVSFFTVQKADESGIHSLTYLVGAICFHHATQLQGRESLVSENIQNLAISYKENCENFNQI